MLVGGDVYIFSGWVVSLPVQLKGPTANLPEKPHGGSIYCSIAWDEGGLWPAFFVFCKGVGW